MSVTGAVAGWINVGAATMWAGRGVGAFIASRRAATSRARDVPAQWQWLALAGLQAVLGAWFISGPSKGYPPVFWWLMAGYAGLLAWMVGTDLRPRLFCGRRATGSGFRAAAQTAHKRCPATTAAG
jgi:hypothetical protein